jgi:hypothetical protein
MMPKSGTRFSEKITLKQKARRRAGAARRISAGARRDSSKAGIFCSAALAEQADLAKLYAVTDRRLIPVQEY